MLQTQTVLPNTLELLRNLQSITELQSFRLAGGTALALQLGHRFSIDLDFFSFNSDVPADIPAVLRIYGLEVENVSISDRIHIYNVNKIKVDIENYRYDWLKGQIIVDNLRLASLEDITAMKLSAITNRGTKKDFVDLFFLLKIFEFKQLQKYYNEKYPEASDFLLYKSLLYFEDAENNPMPKMFEKLNWKDVKNTIAKIIRQDFLLS